MRHSTEYDGSFGSACDPRQGHIPGAIHLDVDELRVMTEAEVQERLGVEPGSEVVVYCHSGSRSALAAQILRAARLRGAQLRGLVARVVEPRAAARDMKPSAHLVPGTEY